MKKNKLMIILFVVACLLILIKQGIKALIACLCPITIICALIIAPLWLVAFIIGCNSIGFKKTLKELNPLVMIKEVLFEDWED